MWGVILIELSLQNNSSENHKNVVELNAIVQKTYNTFLNTLRRQFVLIDLKDNSCHKPLFWKWFSSGRLSRYFTLQRKIKWKWKMAHSMAVSVSVKSSALYSESKRHVLLFSYIQSIVLLKEWDVVLVYRVCWKLGMHSAEHRLLGELQVRDKATSSDTFWIPIFVAG